MQSMEINKTYKYMIKRFLLLLLVMLSSVIETSAKDWFLIGEFNEWYLETSLKMDKLEDGRFRITMPSLKGDFKFVADQDWNSGSLGAASYHNCIITGNGTVDLGKDYGDNLVAPKSLENVTITLDVEALKVEFSGLPNNMNDDPTPGPEPQEKTVYICGDVISPEGVENNFLPPTQRNKDTYDKYFRLSQSNDIYKGTYFIMPLKDDRDFPDNLPQFRFFTDLLGWVDTASLGSAVMDFYCEPIDMTGGEVTSDIVDKGLGNWGLYIGDSWSGHWVDITVDLSSMTVSFKITDSGIKDIGQSSDGNEVWFNMQGLKVEKPTKGLYLKVKGHSVEKVML